MIEKFIDDQIDHKEDDVEKIQTKPNMYISYLGQKGALHLAKESINNMIDECINSKSPGKNIDIYLDEVENTLTVSDDGRGIPFDKIELICTNLQSGSKFTRESGGRTAGENGVGLTAINALSSMLKVISRRYGEKAVCEFNDGKLVKSTTITKDSTNKHGTTTIFKPNPFYLSTAEDNCSIPTDLLIKWLDYIVYLLPSDLKINLHVNRIGKESTIIKKYKNKNGLYDLTKSIAKKPILDPIHFHISRKIKEFDKGKEFDRFVGLEVSFTFNSSPEELITESFCNFIHTIDSGIHVDATKNALTYYFSRQTRESLSEKESKKIEIIPQDVTSGMVLSVYLSTELNPHFSGQTKEKVSNQLLFKPLREMVYEECKDYFKKNPKDLKKIITYIKTNAKARIEANKARTSVVKAASSSLDEHRISGFKPALARGKNDYRELLIIEGDSAQGSVNQQKFNEFQASFGLRGLPLNAFTKKLPEVLQNNELRSIISILKCGIGEKFDIKKLWYKKIILMTDSDVDGFYISSLLCAFFLKYMPEIIEGGYLYKAVAPLYRIKDKKKKFILSKKEYVEVFDDRLRDVFKLTDPDDNVVLSKDKFKDFLLINKEYFEELCRVANYFHVNRQLIEFIAINVVNNNDNDLAKNKKFSKDLTKVFPEITMEKNIISGVHEGRYQILSLDKQFFKHMVDLCTIIKNYNKGKMYYIVHELVGKKYVERGLLSVGDFMSMAQKYQPEITHRFKGLGELNPKDLKDTTLDPNNRILIQLTTKDIKNELKKFQILHGTANAERKAMMSQFKIKREDLDN